jgi:hypothetical protein
MRTRTALAAALPLFLLSFGAAYGLSAARKPSADVAGLMEAMQEDRGHLVCPAGGVCLSPQAPVHAVLFYRADDCSIGLYFVAQLEHLYGATSRSVVNVVAVASGTNPRDAALLARASEITYPLYTRPANVARYVSDPRPPQSNKPVLVLVSRGGRVLRTVEAAATVEDQREQLRSLLQSIEEAVHEDV